jgi:hypothetical protein
MLMKYRKKPIVVSAVQWTGDEESLNRIKAMGCLDLRLAQDLGNGATALIIPTLEGDHRANPGDWIICGMKGEFYPCKPDIFEATYEPVDGDDA